jgi:hypothetical protein
MINRVLAKAGCELVPITDTLSSVTSSTNSYMESAEHKSILVNELGLVAQQFFQGRLPELSPKEYDYREVVRDFFNIYNRRPFSSNRGGSGFHNAFWLFLLCRALKPRLIIESGVWKGQTTWLLEQACPDASIHGFDPDLGYVNESLYRKAVFHESDWIGYDFPEPIDDHTLVFFDCHVNHATRIIEAHSRGVRHLVFDDNLPLHKLYIDGCPGTPTADMIYHWPENGPTHIESVHRGKKRIEKIDPDQVWQAKKLMKKHLVFPNVGDVTGFGGFVFLTYVELAGDRRPSG